MFAKDKETNKTISFWHDIPLRNADGTLNFVTEIPKETRPKFEVNTKEPNNPIAQDLKKGKDGKAVLRDYPMNIHWNYGMLPQTWEDPGHQHPEIKGAGGDNDPLDVVEIGNATLPTGSVTAIKPLGILALVDQNELDWKVRTRNRERERERFYKTRGRESRVFSFSVAAPFSLQVIAINAADPRAKDVNDVEDVERVFPGELEKIHAWFRDYKIPDGKPANKFGFNDRVQPKSLALEVINSTNAFWTDLITRQRVNDQGKALA